MAVTFAIMAIAFHTFAISHEVIRNNNEGVFENIFHCKCIVQISRNSSISSSSSIFAAVVSDSKFHAYVFEPREDEKKSYLALPLTWTKANEKLGKGIVNGIPKASHWANSTVNSWQLPLSHPRNNKTNCVLLATRAGVSPIQIYQNYRESTSKFYLVRANNAFVHETGIAFISCGYFQPLEGCETIFKFIGKRWWAKCSDSLNKRKLKWIDMFTDSKSSSVCADRQTSSNSNMSVYDAVYVVSAAWDYNYHHFLIDGITKLIRHIDFLLENPHIKIHIRRAEHNSVKKASLRAAGIAMRRRIFSLLGISEDRIVYGALLAKTVYAPRGIKCNYPIAHAFEIRELARYLLLRSHPNLLTDAEFKRRNNPGNRVVLFGKEGVLTHRAERKNLIIQHRHCETDLTCKHWREWPSYLLKIFQKQFQKIFPTHNIITISSGNSTWTNCLPCQIRAYATADVLVGLHGAGLTNIMFMPPGSLLVEIVGVFDGRMLPLCGYHGTLAASFGLHHLLHYFDWKGNEELNALKVATEAKQFYSFLHPNESFLR